MRWLKIYQYAFERPGHEKITEIYRKIENVYFNKDLETKETVLFQSKKWYSSDNIFPKLLFHATTNDVDDIVFLMKCHENEDVSIREYNLQDQVHQSKKSGQYGEGSVRFFLSQDTQSIFDSW